MKINFFRVLILSIFVVSCGGDNPSQNSQSGFPGFGGPNAQRPNSVETSPVEMGTISEQVRAYGSIRAQNVVVVMPQINNRITNMYVDLGDTVSQGQLLAKIQDATYRDNLAQARSNLQQSRTALRRDSTQFERQQNLMDRGLSSEAELDIAQATYQNSLAQFESARSQLTQAQEDFNNTEIRSPVNGVIVSRSLEVGDLASSGNPIFEVASTAGYESRVYLPSQDWQDVKIGHEVTLRVSNESRATTKGVVSRKSPQLDATTGLGEVVITLNQIGTTIFPGILVENVINIATKDRAITVPRSALVEQIETVINPETNTIDLERTYSVFVSRGDSVAERRELQLGIEQGDKIEVLNGLLPNENIIVTGQQGLEDGARIAVATGERFRAPEERQIEGETRNGNQFRMQGGANPLDNLSEEDRVKARREMQGMSREERMKYIQNLREQQADTSDTTQNN